LGVWNLEILKAACSLRLFGRKVFYQQRNTALRLAVERQINRVEPGILELQLLNIHNEVASAEMRVAREHNLDGKIHARHNRAPIGIHKIQAQLVFALVLMAEGYAQGDGALRMHRRELLG